MRPGTMGVAGRLACSIGRAFEDDSDRWFLWVPVAIGAGAGLYFAAPTEPSGGLVIASVVAAAGLYAVCRSYHPLAGALAAVALLTALGFADAKLRTLSLATPTLERVSGIVTVTGWLEHAELRPHSRYRLSLTVISIEPAPKGSVPARIRLTVASKTPPPASGQAVVLAGRLSPMPGPVEPGGFDFARKAWFAGLGAVGYGLGPPRVLESPPPISFGLWLTTRIDRMRRAIGEAIRHGLPGDMGRLAAALVTGERGAIEPGTLEALRHSGLAHVLAISGMHMGMIAGALFWLLRAGLAAFPGLALNYPIKKWAAALALGGAAFYLVLSGASIATQRAFLMITIMFVAILLDRPALTLRNVAIAAIAILIAFPESIVDVSFQMSFAAVVGLVAVYEALSGRLWSTYPSSALGRAGVAGCRYIGAIALTTLVASIAVAPFAAFHFHKLAQYGLIANLAAMPIFGTLVMPSALVALLVMPFGLEAWPLAVMGFGLETITGVAVAVSGWEGAVIHVAAMPVVALILISFGGLWLCLWRGRLAAFGLVIAALGLALATGEMRPDILIERDGGLLAVRGPSGRLGVPYRPSNTYSLEKWLLADGDPTPPEHADEQSIFACDGRACLARLKGKVVAFIRHPAAIAEECERADIVISQVPVAASCSNARLIVDPRDLWREGAHAIYLDGQSIRVETAAAQRGTRPWVGRGPRSRAGREPGTAHARDAGVFK